MLERINTLSRKQRLTVFAQNENNNINEILASNDPKKISNYILDKNIKIWEQKLAENFTILHSACASDKTDIIITIIEKTKIRLGLDDKSVLTPEEKSENEKIFNDFINAKTDGDNQTALHLASFRGNIKIIKLLIANHAEINALTTNGYNMIHKAAMGNKPSAIVYFNKKYNMNLDDKDENQMTALHLAIRNNMENSVIYLLNLGIDVNMRDKDGNTALHYAVKKKQTRIIKKLIQRGADVNAAEFRRNKTPIMLAKNNKEIMEIFRKKGVCEKLFFKPDISKKTLCSNKNMILFIALHIVIMFFEFFILLPYLENLIFTIIYLVISGLVFVLYSSLSLSNPGKLVNREYLDILDVVEKGQEVEEFCPICLVKTKFRSKHCLICQMCVEDFDHHCFWVGNCIGKKNYCLFFVFLIYILANTLFNMGVNIYFLVTDIRYKGTEEQDPIFPKFYFGRDCFIYQRVVRIVISCVIFAICILFFVPLFNLFRMQLSTAIEKRQLRKDEIEYEKNQMREKLDEEVWEDLTFDNEEQPSIEMNDMTNKLLDTDITSENA